MLTLLWLIAFSFLILGSVLALLRGHKKIPQKQLLEAISVLKPLKGVDSGLEENLITFFELDYPKFELLFCVADGRDPAIPLVRRLQALYPKVSSTLLIGDEKVGMNPKINNLVGAYDFASHDLLLISDSNVRARKSYLRELAAEMKPGVGVVTAIVAGIEPKGFGGWLEAIYLNTFYAKGLSLAFATGNPCVVGKSMLFRRTVAEGFGGVRALSHFLAEDYVIGEYIRKLGLRIVLMKLPIEQYIGSYSFQEFWKRHIRWGRIRKAHAIVPFLLEPLSMPLLSGLLGIVVLQKFFGMNALPAYLLQLGTCFFVDALLCAQVDELRWQTPFVWLSRELVAFPLWLTTALGNSIEWRGSRFTLHRGGTITEGASTWNDQISFGEPLPVLTK